MSTAQLRRKVKQAVDSLDGKKLRTADRLLRQLREQDDATEELLHIPGFTESLARGLKDIAAGRVTSVEKLRRKR